MNNLVIREYQSPFSFLSPQPKRSVNNGCSLAWIDNMFHLGGNNYYLYTCHSCSEIQIKKGKKPKECLIWGGIYD